MTILVGDNDYVDLAGPLRLTPNQYAEFLALLEDLFDVVEEEQVTKIDRKRLGDQKTFAREWSSRELAVLLDWTVPQEETCRRLGRSPMAVQMRLGQYSGPFQAWVKSKGEVLTRENLLRLIQEYMEEQEADRLRRAEEKRRNNPVRIEADIKKLEKRLKSVNLRIRTKPDDQASVKARDEIQVELGELHRRRCAVEGGPFVPPTGTCGSSPTPGF